MGVFFMRTFVALELPPEFTLPLRRTLVLLREAYPHFRWTKEADHHITLAFLGELDEKGVSLLKDAVQGDIQNTESFSIGAGGIITLPSGGSAKVIALGIETGKTAIINLAASFEKKLAALGEKEAYSFRKPEIRPYTPHITLARKGKTAMVLSPEDKNRSIGAQGMILRVTVFKSDLYREGPRYTPLAVFPLKAPEGKKGTAYY
jgi:2'-5' RNA ligase